MLPPKESARASIFEFTVVASSRPVPLFFESVDRSVPRKSTGGDPESDDADAESDETTGLTDEEDDESGADVVVEDVSGISVDR